MNAASTSIEQQAKITQISGKVQLIRDGFFLPAQVGMALLPGDRVVSDISSKAVIQFTGVNDALVIEKGAAATFNIEVVELDAVPQWIATDLYGEGVYFNSQAPSRTESAEADTPDLFGLFGTGGNGSESTGYPVLESIVFLGATAAIYSDNENNDSTTETTTTSSEATPPTPENPPPATGNPDPAPEEPEAGPLDALTAPLSDAIDGLLGAAGLASPLGSLSTASPTLPQDLPSASG